MPSLQNESDSNVLTYENDTFYAIFGLRWGLFWFFLCGLWLSKGILKQISQTLCEKLAGLYYMLLKAWRSCVRLNRWCGKSVPWIRSSRSWFSHNIILQINVEWDLQRARCLVQRHFPNSNLQGNAYKRSKFKSFHICRMPSLSTLKLTLAEIDMWWIQKVENSLRLGPKVFSTWMHSVWVNSWNVASVTKFVGYLSYWAFLSWLNQFSIWHSTNPIEPWDLVKLQIGMAHQLSFASSGPLYYSSN